MKKDFFRGALILTIFGFLGKFIGALYRVPLTHIIGSEGLGIYQMIFPLYSLLLTVSSSAFPNAISKLLSEADAKHDFVNSRLIFRASIKILTILSIAGFLLVIVFAKLIAKLQGNVDIFMCYYAIAPAIVLVGFIAGFRGYFQAKQNMLPSAISGLIEQFMKLLFGLIFAYLFVNQGVIMGAFGALIGVSISEAIALVYLFVRYCFEPKRKVVVKVKNTGVAKNIFSVTIPITIGSIVLPLSQFIDSSIIVNILVSIGYDVGVATKMFGIQTGIVGSIINMPVVFSLAISSAVLPQISSQRIGERSRVHSTIFRSILYTFFVGIACVFLVYILSSPIISILYKNSLSNNDLRLAIELLKIASFSILYLALVQTTTGILQGMGKVNAPVYALLVGGIIKLILNLLIVRIPTINIFGAEIATIICYFIVAIINLINVFRFENAAECVNNCKSIR